MKLPLGDRAQIPIQKRGAHCATPCQLLPTILVGCALRT